MKTKEKRPYAHLVVDARETKKFDRRIHRPHKYSNPYKIGKDGTRAEVLKKFRVWFQKQPTLMRDVEELHGLVLACKCRTGPTRPCHGEILHEFAALPRRKREVLRPISLFPETIVLPDEDSLGTKRRVETTNPASADRKYRNPWVYFRKDRSISPDKTWIFTDGSSTGWFAAVIVRPLVDVRLLCRFVAPTPTRNVGAELNGFLLGLENVKKNSTVVVVPDFLNVAAWMTGAFEIKNDEVRKQIEQAKLYVNNSKLKLSFIHHAGHQKDDSHFTYFNNRADVLCNKKTERDKTIVWSDIENDL